MISAASEVVDIEVHGYLDGELNERRASRVEEYLDQERPAAERLVHYGVQGDLIRRLYGPLINRSMPADMAARLQTINERRYFSKKETERETRSNARKDRFFIAFSVFLFLVVGIVAVWLHEPTWLEPMQTFIKSLTFDKLTSFWS